MRKYLSQNATKTLVKCALNIEWCLNLSYIITFKGLEGIASFYIHDLVQLKKSQDIIYDQTTMDVSSKLQRL